MFNEAGGGNTPRIDEGYYRVPPCEALAHKFFGLLAKAEYTFIQTKIERTTGSSTSAYWMAEGGGDALRLDARRNKK
jgi:hypothetical protein